MANFLSSVAGKKALALVLSVTIPEVLTLKGKVTEQLKATLAPNDPNIDDRLEVPGEAFIISAADWVFDVLILAPLNGLKFLL